MEYSVLNEEKDTKDAFSTKLTFKFDLKNLLLPIMQKNRRSFSMSILLILIHFIFLFGLQIRASKFPLDKGLMPSIHYILSQFNMILLLSDSTLRVYVMFVFFAFNTIYIISMALLGCLGGLPKSHPFRIVLTKLHILFFQIYIWLIMIPCTQISSNINYSQDVFIYKVISISNIVFVFIISNFIEYNHININFKYEDNLDTRADITDKILLNYKIIVCIMSGINFHQDYFLLILFFLYIVDYIKKINYYVEKVSQFYLCCLLTFMFAALVYFSFHNDFIKLKNIDISYLLLIAGSLILKTTCYARDFLIVHKLKLINKYGIRNKAEFDLYIRENYLNLKNFRENLNSKILFLSFFSFHQGKCQLTDCTCKLVKLDSEASYFKNKKLFKRVVESYFIEYLSTISPSDFEDVFLVYCSFITNILKIPSKALNLLLVNSSKIKSIKNQILSTILIKKSKKSLEKKLLNNDQYAQSFSTVIVFDHQVRTLEQNLRKIIMKEIQIANILLNENDGRSMALDKFIKIGVEVIKEIEKNKQIIRKLFDKNLNHTRLIQLTTLVIKYLSEDIVFKNFYKQLNIKRINDKIMKRKKDAEEKIDIFDKDAGVIFITLSKNIGSIKKFSKTTPKIFGSTPQEMKKQNISNFMPCVFADSHDKILGTFIKSGKPSLLINKTNILYGITKQNFLIHLNLIIRFDTFFNKDFYVGSYVKTLKNTMSKTILVDIHGNFINCSKEVSSFLNLERISPEQQRKISMILLIPDIMERLLPFNYEEILLKRNTNFRLKGFFLTPIDLEEKDIEKISIKKEIFNSFDEFKKSKEPAEYFQELRKTVLKKLTEIIASEYSFYRIHFTLVVQNFSNNCVNVRLIEIFDIFEIKDIKLKIQYLAKRSKKIKEIFKQEVNNFQNIELNSKKSPRILLNQESKNIESPARSLVIEEEKSNDNNLNLKPDLLDLNVGIDSYISVTNRSEVDKKVSALNDLITSIIEPKSSQIISSQIVSETSNLLQPIIQEKSVDKLSTIEQSESEITIDREEELDFDEKISEMSNNMLINSSDDESIGEETNTHTHGASQASRISSHASGDGKKSTVDLLITIGIKKIIYLRVISIILFIGFIVIPILFFVLHREQTLLLETTLQNSGVFHDQLSPLCVLVRDTTIFKFYYDGVLVLKNPSEIYDLLEEARSSVAFNNLLLQKAYKNGIAKADSSVDFIYSTDLTVYLHNITLYTDILANMSQSVLLKLRPDNIYSLKLNIPQAVLFFLASANHIYYSNNLNKSNDALDSYNYFFFLRENILSFTKTMLVVFETNKEKISGSVDYMNNLNIIFFLLIVFGIVYGVTQITYIAIKSKYKANKFCSLFFHFQDNEIEERNMKLKGILDRYFEGKSKVIISEVSNLTKSEGSNKKTIAFSFNTDNINLMKSEHGAKRSFKRSNSIKQMKGKQFQQFLFLFLILGLGFVGTIIGVFVTNFVENKAFSDNVIEITKDLESVETYVITMHIQYSVNSILLGLYDEDADRKIKIKEEADILLTQIEEMQGVITDLTSLFKLSNTDQVLTQLKFSFFSKDICELYEEISVNINQQTDSIKEISKRLKGRVFCQKLLKGILTKGSSSYAFELTEIFKQWQTYLRNHDFRKEETLKIIESQEFIDINYALPYIYALGLYDITEMMDKSLSYFQKVRNDRLTWIIITLIIVFILFSYPVQKLITYLRVNTEESFSLIKIFPIIMITNNKMLENKISRISRQQKI